MADSKKIQVIREMVAQGRIRIKAEPKRSSYDATYHASEEPEENYYAVYGPSDAIALLSKKGCLAKSNRPGCIVDGVSKAYFNNDDTAALNELCEKSTSENPVFALHEPGAGVQAVGMYHTGFSMDDEPEDTLSYLVMSAESSQHFDTPKARLTQDGSLYLQMHQVGRSVGELLVIPVRRSMAYAIKRAHPEAVEIEGDAVSCGPVNIQRMQHIAAQLHEDARFEVPSIEQSIALKPEPETPEKNVSEPTVFLPRHEVLAELEPYVIGFERYEQIGGGATTRVQLRMQEGLRDVQKRLEQCTEQDGFFMALASGSKGSQVSTKLSEVGYQIMREQFPHLPITTKVQEFQTSWLRHQPIQISNDPNEKKLRIAVSEVRLARTEEGDAIHNWLVITAPYMKRAQVLASSMGIAAERQRPITHGSEQPSILVVPITASVTESLITNPNYPIPHDETPYASTEEMDAALRASVTDRTLLSRMEVEEPRKVSELPLARSQINDEEKLRAKAAAVVFNATNDRLWIHYARHEPTKRGSKPPQEMLSIGIRIPSAKAKAFESDLRVTGFIDLPGREFRYIGSTGEGALKNHLYQLKLKPQDVRAWSAEYTDDMHWPEAKQADARHLVMLTDEQVQKRLKRFLRKNDPKEHPRDTAWRSLARLANEGHIRCMQVRYSKEDIEAMGQALERQLGVIDGAAAPLTSMAYIRDEWGAQPIPTYLHHGLDNSLDQVKRHVPHLIETLRTGRDLVAEAMEKRDSYYQWLAHQPRNEDGSVTLQYLVMANPRGQALFHLRQANDFSQAEERVRLFPQEPFILKNILEHDKPLYLWPVEAGFVDRLANHHGRLEAVTPEPVLLSAVRPQIRALYGPRVEVNEPYDVQAAATQLEIARQQKARQRLKSIHFPNCRNMMLYGELKPDNNIEHLGQRPEGDRIGIQHGMGMRIESKLQWTQHLEPMLQEMQRAAMLQARKEYVVPLGAIDPAPLQAKWEEAQQAVDALNDVAFALTRYDEDPQNPSHRNYLANAIQTLLVDQENLPDPLYDVVGELKNLHSGRQIPLMRATISRCRKEASDCRTAYHSAADSFNHAREIAQAHGMMKQEATPLFYVRGHESGYTLEELDLLVKRNFLAKVREPLDVAFYLSNDHQLAGDYSDENMIKFLKSSPPEPVGEGKWTGRENRRRVQCPSNVTLNKFFEALDEFFGKVPLI